MSRFEDGNPEVVYDPSVLEGRLGEGENPEQFIERLRWTQGVPCPWGSLRGRTSGEVRAMCSRGGLNFPLALELGCGIGFNGRASTTYPGIGIAAVNLLSDRVAANNPYQRIPPNYVQIDLRKPEQVDLGGIRCHWAAAHMVFTCDTYDGNQRYGVDWPSQEVARRSLESVTKLLLPNALLCLGPSSEFSEVVCQYIQTCGMEKFYLFDSDEVLLQKRA